MEKIIINYLEKNKKGYTKDLYKICGSRSAGFTLNKFRKLLNGLCDSGLIKYNAGDYPYWSL